MSASGQFPGRAVFRADRVQVGRGCARLGTSRMDKAIAKLNIQHYKLLLVTETDAAKREIILALRVF